MFQPAALIAYIYTSILGEPCDVDGQPLDPNFPEPTVNVKDPDDWTPYDCRLAFETAEFAYKKCKMSAGNFDILSELWTASLAPHDATPPFASHSDLCKTIDATPIGGVPWRTVTLSYNGMKPDDAPPWMEAKYTVWYRDPHTLFKHMIEIQNLRTILTTHHFEGMIPMAIGYIKILCRVIGHGSKQ